MPGSHDHLARQLAVLRQCAGGARRFADLRTHLGVPASTLSRQLRALTALDLLRSGRDGRYALAPAATALALDLLGGGAADADAALPAVAALARQTGASAACWGLAGRRLILLAKHEVADGFHYLDRFAHRTPETSVFGLALLAALPREQQARHLRSATAEARRLARTATTDGVLATTLSPEPHWRCAAAILRDGTPVGAVGISRHAQPPPAVAARDRRCVAAAARRLAVETPG